jgi:hypothetical protein
MYCASCGERIDEGVKYCPDCGHKIGTPPTESADSGSTTDTIDGEDDESSDYDFVMSIEDAIRRRTPLRLVLDVIALLVTAGFWAGWLLMEFIQHHYKLKKGETEPWEEGDKKSFNIL